MLAQFRDRWASLQAWDAARSDPVLSPMVVCLIEKCFAVKEDARPDWGLVAVDALHGGVGESGGHGLGVAVSAVSVSGAQPVGEPSARVSAGLNRADRA